MKKTDRGVYIIGAGGHAKVVIATLRDSGIEVTGAYDDDPRKIGSEILGVPIFGSIEKVKALTGVKAVVAIGDNRKRKEIIDNLSGSVQWITAIHPRACVHESVQMGAGTVVFAGAVIQPDTIIGPHTIVNTGATIDHDGRIGSYVHVAPGAHLSGGVHLEEGCFIGIGASIIPGRTVGAWSTIGAGAAVITNIPPDVTAVGIPARVTRMTDDR